MASKPSPCSSLLLYSVASAGVVTGCSILISITFPGRTHSPSLPWSSQRPLPLPFTRYFITFFLLSGLPTKHSTLFPICSGCQKGDEIQERKQQLGGADASHQWQPNLHLSTISSLNNDTKSLFNNSIRPLFASVFLIVCFLKKENQDFNPPIIAFLFSANKMFFLLFSLVCIRTIF